VIPVLAAAEILQLPVPDPSLPGPFSLADATDTTARLVDAGFVDVTVEAGPDHIVLSDAADLRAVAGRMLLQNPLTSPPFTRADDATRSAALDALAAALGPNRSGDTLRLDMGTWIVSAHTPD
ncbi:MAG TPA: hypothetical protein VFN21_06445, partial [Acidimicrobiales bacterium]|nr:hypothetical protein [Acidimicrobiales bacterium]